MTMNIPDTAKKGATSRILGLLRATDMTGSRTQVASDILISLDRYVAAAVVAELEAQARAFEYDADELDDPKAEYWRAAAQLLRDRVAELRDGA